MKSELVLLFDTDSKEHILDELNEAFDKHSSSGSRDHSPSMIVVNEEVWSLIDGEIQPLLSARYNKTVVRSYDMVTKYTKPQETTLKVPTGGIGWKCFLYRNRPVVAIDGHNVIADRVGGMSE